MKAAFLILIVSCSIISLRAQVNTTIIHQKTFGGSGNDNISKIIKTNDGYLLAGNSVSGISGDKTDTCRGGSDLWLIKTDDSFNIQWQKTIGGSIDETLMDLETTNDSGYIITAYTNSPISGEKLVANYGMVDYWIIRTDRFGNIIWQKTYGGLTGSNNYAGGILKKSMSEYILFGYSDSNTGGLKSENSRGYSDIWVLSIDTSGNLLWDKTIGGDFFESAQFCTNQSSNNNTVITITTNSSLSGDLTEPSYGSSDALVIKLNSNNGQLLSQKRIGGSRGDLGAAHIQIVESLYIISQSASDSSGTKTENNRGIDTLSYDYWITKLSDTTIIWDKTIGGNKGDVPKGAFLTADNNQIVIYGFSESTISGEKTESCRGLWDYWLVAIDTNANILWQKTFGGSSYDLPMDMLMLGHNHYVVAGSSQSPISGDKTEQTRGGRDYWILEISTTMSIEDFSQKRLHIFPNPVSDFVTVELPENSNKGQLYVFDITGAIMQSEIINAESNRVNLSNLASGVYFISYFDENGKSWSAEVQRL